MGNGGRKVGRKSWSRCKLRDWIVVEIKIQISPWRSRWLAQLRQRRCFRCRQFSEKVSPVEAVSIRKYRPIASDDGAEREAAEALDRVEVGKNIGCTIGSVAMLFLSRGKSFSSRIVQ